MSDLTDFLLARIAEDEAVAREVQAKVAGDDSGWNAYYEDAHGSTASAYFDLDYRQGGYTIAAARVLAECEAKRRLLALHTSDTHDVWNDDKDDYDDEPFCRTCTEGRSCSCCVTNEDRVDLRYCLIARALAIPYADHPDYREAWKP